MLDAGFEEEMFVSAREADHNEDLEGMVYGRGICILLQTEFPHNDVL